MKLIEIKYSIIVFPNKNKTLLSVVFKFISDNWTFYRFLTYLLPNNLFHYSTVNCYILIYCITTLSLEMTHKLLPLGKLCQKLPENLFFSQFKFHVNLVFLELLLKYKLNKLCICSFRLTLSISSLFLN